MYVRWLLPRNSCTKQFLILVFLSSLCPIVPNLGRIYIDPVAGMSLVSWSLDHFVPSPTPYGDEGRGCYYIMFLRGAEDRDERFKFWIEIKVYKGSYHISLIKWRSYYF